MASGTASPERTATLQCSEQTCSPGPCFVNKIVYRLSPRELMRNLWSTSTFTIFSDAYATFAQASDRTSPRFRPTSQFPNRQTHSIASKATRETHLRGRVEYAGVLTVVLHTRQGLCVGPRLSFKQHRTSCQKIQWLRCAITKLSSASARSCEPAVP